LRCSEPRPEHQDLSAAILEVNVKNVTHSFSQITYGTLRICNYAQNLGGFVKRHRVIALLTINFAWRIGFVRENSCLDFDKTKEWSEEDLEKADILLLLIARWDVAFYQKAEELQEHFLRAFHMLEKRSFALMLQRTANALQPTEYRELE
jgi:hypothetical protein